MRTQTSEATPGGCWSLLLGRRSRKQGQDPSGAAWLSTTSPRHRDRWVVFLHLNVVTLTDRMALRGHGKASSLTAEGDSNKSHLGQSPVL